MMIHDDVYKGRQKEVMKVLDFLHEGERKKRARQKHVTLDYAQRWRAWWNFGQFGRLDNPAGFANAQIRQGHEPPGPQLQMPEGTLGEILEKANGHNGQEREEQQAKSLAAVGLRGKDLSAWQATLQSLQRQMSQATFNQWLRDTTPIRREEEALIIGVRSAEAKAWLDNRLLETIARTATQQGIMAFRFEVRAANLVASEV